MYNVKKHSFNSFNIRINIQHSDIPLAFQNISITTPDPMMFLVDRKQIEGNIRTTNDPWWFVAGTVTVGLLVFMSISL